MIRVIPEKNAAQFYPIPIIPSFLSLSSNATLGCNNQKFLPLRTQVHETFSESIWVASYFGFLFSHIWCASLSIPSALSSSLTTLASLYFTRSLTGRLDFVFRGRKCSSLASLFELARRVKYESKLGSGDGLRQLFFPFFPPLIIPYPNSSLWSGALSKHPSCYPLFIWLIGISFLINNQRYFSAINYAPN